MNIAKHAETDADGGIACDDHVTLMSENIHASIRGLQLDVL
jgi:hypothetical protein